MRIQSLHLIAFGHFTNAEIDLSRGKEGLHIIYGPNESGKSSSLRALRQVLYGIPAKSTDNFKHAHPDMRIGVVLKHSDGSILRILRRKGNTKTLRKLDAENEIVDPVVLQHYLANINQTTFETMFGIDHPTLVSGGEAILKGNGELGQLLFSAGAGIADLRSVLASLEKDYQDLYTRTGTTRVINRHLSTYAEAKKILRDSELPNSEWEKHDQALRQAVSRKQQLDKLLAETQIKVSTLKRFRDAIPLIAERNLYFNQLLQLKDIVLLPENFQETARNLLDHILILRNEEKQDAGKLDELNRELVVLRVPEGILEQATNIELLQQKLGSHQKAALDRLSLEQTLIEEQERTKACLRDLGRKEDFEAASSLRLSVQEKTRLRKLALERRALWQAYSDAQALRQRTEQRLKQCSDNLVKFERLPACEKLLICYKRIQQDPQMEERIITDSNKLDRTFKQIQLEVKKLQLKALPDLSSVEECLQTLAQLTGILVPDPQTIDATEKEWSQLGKEIDALKSKSTELNNELRELQFRLQEHDLKIAAPTESDLQAARKLRNDGWNLVLSAWKKADTNEDLAGEISDYLSAANSGELAAAYESSVSKSDIIADRLRHEADQVAQKIQLTAYLHKIQAHLSDITDKLTEREAQLSQRKAEWSNMWHDITERSLTPPSARLWLSQFESITTNLAAIVENLELNKQNINLLTKLKSELIEALLEANWPLSTKAEPKQLLGLFDQAQQCLEHDRSLKQSQTELEKELSKLQIDFSNNLSTEQTRKAEIDSWAATWQPAVEALGLSATTSPEELTAFLDRLEQFFSHYDQIQNLKRRIAGIDRDAELFTAEVEQLTRQLSSIGPGNGVPEQAALELFNTLKKAKEVSQRRHHLTERRDELMEANECRRASIETLNDKLNLMMKEAGVDSGAELLETAKKSQEKRRLVELIDNYDRQLIRLAENNPLEAYISACRTHTLDELDLQISQIEKQQREIEQERDELQLTIGSEKQILQTMDGSSNAAEAANRLQQVLSELGQDVEQYCRLRIASVILKTAIERYREKNQSPILRKASTFFARLSNGSFSGLQEDFNERGEPILLGVRSDNSSLTPIEGMSEGTCDQVYLALRLAGLSLYLDKEEALPFIVDDILVNFDDQRSLATLRVLAELSRRTQVIMFTHHSHIVDLAREHLDSELVFVSRLGELEPKKFTTVPQQTMIPGIATN